MPNGSVRPHPMWAHSRMDWYSGGLEDQYTRPRGIYVGQQTHSLGAEALGGRFKETQLCEKWTGVERHEMSAEEIDEMIAMGRKIEVDHVEDVGQEPIEDTQAWLIYQQQLALLGGSRR